MGTSKRERQKANRAQARQARVKQQQRAKVRKRGLLLGIGIPILVIALFLISRSVTGGSSSPTIPTNGSDLATATTAPQDTSVSSSTTTDADTIAYGSGACPKTDGTQKRKTDFTDAPKKCIDPSKTYTATIATTEGDIVVALDTKNTPYTVNNWVSIARYKYYDGTTVFRTDPSIDIIQLGGNSASDQFGYTITDEGKGYTYEEGDVVMARTGAPNSAGAQYFIVTGKNGSLLNSQGTYVKFGRVSGGLDVAKKIIGLHQATSDGLGGKPSRTVTVESVTISEK